MKKLQDIFTREYNSNVRLGDSHNRAVYWAIDYIETGIDNVKSRLDYEEFRVSHAEYYTIFETEKESVEAELEQSRIEKLREKAVISYHPIGSVFNIKTSKGSYKLKVVEQNSCSGCFFSKVDYYAQAGYPVYTCRYDYRVKNVYCSAEMREDKKAVAYKVCK